MGRLFYVSFGSHSDLMPGTLCRLRGLILLLGVLFVYSSCVLFVVTDGHISLSRHDRKGTTDHIHLSKWLLLGRDFWYSVFCDDILGYIVVS